MNKIEIPFQPIVIGGDALGYSFVRSFAAEYGVRTKVLATADIKYTSLSKWADYEVISDIDQPDVLIKWLEDHKDIFGDKKPIIFGGAGDWNARTFSKNKAKLESWGYVVPYIEFDLLDRITQKDNFYGLCDKLGIPYPKTWIVPFGKEAVERADKLTGGTEIKVILPENLDALNKLEYPVAAKPSNSAAWHFAEIKDRHKVYKAESAEQLKEIIKNISESSYDRSLLIQEFLSPRDDALRTVTTFSVDGEIVTSSTGHVLVQDRSASGIGNPLVIISEEGGKRQDLLEYVGRILRETHYEGFANFDVMNGADGQPRILEVNTRPGRNTWYMSLGGCPFVIPMIEYYINHKDLKKALTERELRCDDEFLFSMIPKKYLMREISETDEVRIRDYYKKGLTSSPLLNKRDSLGHIFWSEVNFHHGVLRALNLQK